MENDFSKKWILLYTRPPFYVGEYFLFFQQGLLVKNNIFAAAKKAGCGAVG